MVRGPTCSYDPDKTVLAHIRRGRVGGMSRKPHDLCAVLACFECHNFIGDGKRDADEYIVDAICRTIDYWDKEGYL